MNFPADLDGLIDGIPARHDDEDVHVAVGVGRAVGAGAEENDLVGAEALGDLAGEPSNDSHRHVGPEIEAPRCGGVNGTGPSAHGIIVSRSSSIHRHICVSSFRICSRPKADWSLALFPKNLPHQGSIVAELLLSAEKMLAIIANRDSLPRKGDDRANAQHQSDRTF